MIEKLNNCPNCAGILDEVGRCKYCGSKIYDFLSMNFDNNGGQCNAKTYIRLQSRGKIFLMPILAFKDASITVTPHYASYDDCSGNMHEVRVGNTTVEAEIHCICGEPIYMMEAEK